MSLVVENGGSIFLKHCYLPKSPRGVTTQNIINMYTNVRISNPTNKAYKNLYHQKKKDI
jgi:hypothetical protein